MTEKTVPKEKNVILVHEIDIDSCIADEIIELNNIHHVFTLSSCCGHGKGGYIIVAGTEIDKMADLGYEMTTLKYLDSDIDLGKDRITLCSFKPKSECKCAQEEIDDKEESKMESEKYNRLKITTKKGFVFEIVIADWLTEGDYEFGKVELVEKINEEQAQDYIRVIENLCDMTEDDE